MEMISQRCPKCNSTRIRAGYRPTLLWSKLLFRYNLLCNNCNWEFKGFAVPGTVSSKTKRDKKKQSKFSDTNQKDSLDTDGESEKTASDSSQSGLKKRVKIKLRT